MREMALIFVVCLAGCGAPASTAQTPPKAQVSERQTQQTAKTTESRLTPRTVGSVILEPKTVVDGNLSLLIPQEFTILDDESLRIKYPSANRPTLVYSNESGAINVAINHTKNQMPQGQLAIVHKQIDDAYRKQFPMATWFTSDITTINGRDWFKLSLRTPALDTAIRNIIVGTSLKGRLLLVTFNVTKELETEWLEVADAVVQSLRIAD